jgi:translation initiation factor 1 (eIF-1/SUI1)
MAVTKTLTPAEKEAEKAAVAAAKVAAAEEKAAEKAAKEAEKKTEVTMTGRTGRGRVITRVYTKEVHGDEFMDLAKEAAEKFDGTIA